MITSVVLLAASFLSCSNAAFDFHLTGHGSSPPRCSNPGFVCSTNTSLPGSKPPSQKGVVNNNRTNKPTGKRNDKMKNVESRSLDGLVVPPEETSVANLSPEVQTEKAGVSDNISGTNNPGFEKTDAKSAPKTEVKAELGKPEYAVFPECLQLLVGFMAFNIN